MHRKVVAIPIVFLYIFALSIFTSPPLLRYQDGFPLETVARGLVKIVSPLSGRGQNVAMGFNTDPVAPGTAAGAAVTRNSQRFRRSASRPINSRSRLSKIGIPIATSASV